MRKNLGLLTFFASLLISGSSGAQDTSTRAASHYPEHAVRMVVGFTAGGPTDVIARIIAEKLSTSVRQQFYVDNRPGAGGNIASAEVAKAAPVSLRQLLQWQWVRARTLSISKRTAPQRQLPRIMPDLCPLRRFLPRTSGGG